MSAPGPRPGIRAHESDLDTLLLVYIGEAVSDAPEFQQVKLFRKELYAFLTNGKGLTDLTQAKFDRHYEYYLQARARQHDHQPTMSDFGRTRSELICPTIDVCLICNHQRLDLAPSDKSRPATLYYSPTHSPASKQVQAFNKTCSSCAAVYGLNTVKPSKRRLTKLLGELNVRSLQIAG